LRSFPFVLQHPALISALVEKDAGLDAAMYFMDRTKASDIYTKAPLDHFNRQQALGEQLTVGKFDREKYCFFIHRYSSKYMH
jgi:esterase/lipase superfamily enzyme